MKYLFLLIALAANGCEPNEAAVNEVILRAQLSNSVSNTASGLKVADELGSWAVRTNLTVVLNLEHSLTLRPDKAVSEYTFTNTIISQPAREAIMDAAGQKVEHVGPEVRMVVTQVINRKVLALTWNGMPRFLTNDVVLSETRVKQQKVEGWTNQQ